MTILQRYLSVTLIVTTLLALLTLVALFSFFSIIDQLEATGRGDYGVPQAFLYVLLTTPRLAYELFPIAAVTGSMGTLGLLSHNNELAVIRTAGVSRMRLAVLLVRSGFFLVVLAVIIGELIAPITEELAQQSRTMALSASLSLDSDNGFWARDGNSYINIRKVLPDNQVRDVYIYEFDDANRLRSSIYAGEASYGDGKWLLQNVRQTDVSEAGVSVSRLEAATWESQLEPVMLNFVAIEPQRLTFRGLFQYIHYLKQNGQDTTRYEQALWTKLIKPFSIIAMLLLAIPLVRTHSRDIPVARQIFTGVLAGIIFHLCNQISGHLGIVYDLPPLFSVALPTLLLSGYILLSLVRAH